MNFLNNLSVHIIVEIEPRVSPKKGKCFSTKLHSLTHAHIFSLTRFPRLSLITGTNYPFILTSISWLILAGVINNLIASGQVEEF